MGLPRRFAPRNDYFSKPFTIIRAVGFNISEEWIKDTNPMEDDTRDDLKSLLIVLEQEARTKEEARKKKKGLNRNVSRESGTD